LGDSDAWMCWVGCDLLVVQFSNNIRGLLA